MTRLQYLSIINECRTSYYATFDAEGLDIIPGRRQRGISLLRIDTSLETTEGFTESGV